MSDTTDYRNHPELYEIAKGEQGVLTVEPYKSELLPQWRFATPEKAKKSTEKLLTMFEDYKTMNDFVGMDMARKFLQMGYTRSRRYANHKSGRKYDGPVPVSKKGQSGAHGRKELPRLDQKDQDPAKIESAKIFYAAYVKTKEDPDYQRLKALHKERYG